MTRLRYLAVFALATLLAQFAHAHRFAPSLLQVTEIGDKLYNVVWKTPAQGVSNIPLQPLWPEQACTVLNPSPPQLEGTGKVSSWQLHYYY